MCLRLRHAEAVLWKREGLSLFEAAFRDARKMDVDPLLGGAPRLSRLVSAIDSAKKRHGLLIERALMNAINMVPGWTAEKIRVPTGRRRREVDCVAFDVSTNSLYLFECKRGHGELDRNAQRELDRRLEDLIVYAPFHLAARGWTATTTRAFILSFYGRTWRSRHEILDMDSASSVFPPCAARFASELRDFTEEHGSDCAEDEAGAALGIADRREGQRSGRRRTLFDAVDEPDNSGRDVLVTAEGWHFADQAWSPDERS